MRELDDSTADPIEKAAISIAHAIARVGMVPTPSYRPVTADQFSVDQRRWADRVAADLAAQGFTLMADVSPDHIAASTSRPTFMRISRDADATVLAASWRLVPPDPGRLERLLLKIVRKSVTPASTVELQTRLSDDSFVLTNNGGDLSFFKPAPSVDTEKMPTTTSVPQLVALHRERVAARLAAEPGITALPVPDLATLTLHEARQVETINAYRRSINFVTEEELRAALGSHYARMADLVRAKIRALEFLNPPGAL